MTCPQGEGIDLGHEVGLRIWVRVGEGRVELTFQFHHSCCDGVGALRFIGDLLAAYGTQVAPSERSPVLRPVDPTRLSRRGNFLVRTPAPVTRGQATWSAIREAYRWLTCRPEPVALPTPATAGEPRNPEFPRICSHTFSVAQTRQLRTAATRQGATLNDLLLRDMFLALIRWNESQQQPLGPRHWLRINMPTNLRGGDDEQTPAANMMSYAFLTRRVRDCQNPQTLLGGINWETGMIKRWGLGLQFLGGIAAAQRIPGLLPLVLRGSRCLATVVVTNVGEIARRFGARFPNESGRLRCGNLVLEQLVGVPPIRRGTRAGVSVVLYSGALTLTMRCDPQFFSLAETGQLLMQYVDQLQQTAEEIGVPAARAGRLAQANQD